MKRIRNAGFTLVELMVVVAIIGVLASLILPALAFARERANRAACTSSLREVSRAAILFQEDEGGLPDGDGLAFLEGLYDNGDGILKPKVLVCKSSDEKPAERGQPLQTANVSYRAYRQQSDPLSSGDLASDSSEIPIAADRDGDTHGSVYIVAFFDGRVTQIDRDEFENKLGTGGFMDGKTLQGVLAD